MATSRAARAAQTREAVLTTARGLIASNGYDATSLQQIADAMGVRKANVYYYFKTKEEILAALLTPMTDALDGLLDRAEALPPGAGRAGVLVEGFVDQVLAAHRSVGSLGLGDPALRRDLPIARRLEDLALRGMRALYGPDPTPQQQAGYWLAQDLGPVLRRLGHLPDPELREVLVTLCRRLLAAPL